MIASLYQWLTDPKNLTKVRTWYQAGTTAASNPNTPKPYGIIHIGSKISVLGSAGSKREIQLDLVFPVGSWDPVIEAAEELESKLDGQILTRVNGGERYRIEYETTIGDIEEPVIKAFVNTLSFTVPIRA